MHKPHGPEEHEALNTNWEVAPQDPGLKTDSPGWWSAVTTILTNHIYFAFLDSWGFIQGVNSVFSSSACRETSYVHMQAKGCVK